MDIGGNARGGGSDRKRRSWPIHTRHILYRKIQPRQLAHGNTVVRTTVVMSKETKDAIMENDSTALLAAMKGHDVNAVSRPKCDSALHVAAEVDAENSVAALIDIGANVHLQDYQGRTPLHWAAISNASKAIKVLINKGLAVVDFSEQGPMGHCSPRSSGDTALHMACRYGAIESVEALLEAGADPNARNNDLRTPLVATFHPVRGKSSLAKAVEVMRLLLKFGGNPEIPSGHEYERIDKEGKLVSDTVFGDAVKLVGGFRVPLHYAAHENSTEICKMLVEAGASGTQRDFFGERPVSYAKPKSECHRVLLELEKKRSTDSLPGM